MFAADSVSSMGLCLAEDKLRLEDSASCKYLSRPFDTLSQSDCTSSFEVTASELSDDKVGYNEP